ncbi:hypothetical protein BJX61DRAFT_545043 [Aspergillus egyptiacus]|nr:hypothetical protein BJX61DRAFT_545043 [Aspergillus egyptiacus]
MGLAAPRKKTKISHDPNNTQWSRSTTGFGHKILSSQGWTPGSFLGARNAAHADMFTSASASHIRVVVKDDTLGLGARSKCDILDEPTGLDAFKGLLGRLNGKSDAELQVDQRKRDDVKLARYAATKWQAVRFISAGLLTQEKVEKPSSQKEQKSSTEETTSSESSADGTGNGTVDEGEGVESLERRHKKSKKGKDDKKDRNEKKEKREKKKRDKKDTKRKRTEEQEDQYNSLRKQSSEPEAHISKDQEQPSSDAGSTMRDRRPIGRHMIRGRHIAQKKKAIMDEKSLNEIFMVKS